MRQGFTLIECALAGAIIGLLSLVLLEGVIVSTRIARENSQLLQAEAIAWDAAWKRFNERYADLEINERATETLSATAAPGLQDPSAAPTLSVRIEQMDIVGWRTGLKKIIADVEWGPSARRQRLSDSGHAACVCRSELGRVP